MGQISSVPQVEGFTKEEIARLEKRFKKLDLDNSGSLSVKEFVSIPELKENPLVKRVVEVLDLDLSGDIDFKEFVMGLVQFASRDQDPVKRLRFLFSIYDIDRDGYISNGELFQVLKMMTGKNLKDAQLQQIVDRTIIYLDKDMDGRINIDEFCQVVEKKSLGKVAKMMMVEV